MLVVFLTLQNLPQRSNVTGFKYELKKIVYPFSIDLKSVLNILYLIDKW